MVAQRFLLFGCLTLQYRWTDDDVCHHHRLALIVKRQNICRIVFAAKLMIEFAAFFFVNKTNGEFSVELQRGTNPASHRTAMRQLILEQSCLLQVKCQFMHDASPFLRSAFLLLYDAHALRAVQSRHEQLPHHKPQQCAPPAGGAQHHSSGSA